MDKQIEEIWTDLHQELKKFILSKVKDAATGEDILQDVFLKIQRNIHTLSDSSKLTSWVYQITRNAVVDHFRKTSLAVPIDGFDLAEEENEEPLYQSLSSCINQKISQLPEKYRQAILLTYFDDYAQIKLAEELNISYSGAKTRVQRGREKLNDPIVACKNIATDDKGRLIAYHTEK